MTSDLLSGTAMQEALLDEASCLETALHRLDVDPGVAQRLKHCEREVTVTTPVGETAYVAHRVRHLDIRGTALGPMLLSREAHPAQLRALAQSLTWQMALLGIPAGGSAGAVVCDPRQLAESDLRNLVERCVRLLWRNTAGDLISGGAQPQALHWMAEACGDPRQVCRLRDWPIKPTAYAMQALLEQTIGPLEGKRIAVQGLGELGLDVIALLAGRGARLVAVADSSGGALRSDGIELAALRRWLDAHKLLFAFDGAEPVTNADVLECECDALVLAAGERQITEENAGRVRAAILGEAGLGAVTPAAAECLHQRGVGHVPALIATAATPLAAWMEWTNASFWTTPGARVEMLTSRVLDAWTRVRSRSLEQRMSAPQAALELAVERVGEELSA